MGICFATTRGAISFFSGPRLRVRNALSFMLTGMALFKCGVLDATELVRIRRRLAFIGVVVGGPRGEGTMPVRAVERIGRMALTTYLLHSIVFLGIFHVARLLPFDGLDHPRDDRAARRRLAQARPIEAKLRAFTNVTDARCR